MKAKFLIMFLMWSFGCLTKSASATTIYVNNINDAGSGSLRAALAATVNGDTIRFNPALVAGGNDTIKLVSPLTVATNLVIIGLQNLPGSIYISGQNTVQIFNLGTMNVELNSLCLISGRATNGGAVIMGAFNAVLNIRNCLFTGNTATQRGGAIHFYSGELNIENSVFSNNTATTEGGAVYHQIAQTTQVYGSNFENNVSARGGAVSIVAGGSSTYLTFISSELNSNQSSGEGAAVYYQGRYFTMDSSVVSFNTSNANLYRGILFLGNSTRHTNTITNTVISQNNGIGVVGYISSNVSTSVETETSISYSSIYNNTHGGVVSYATTVSANAISRVIVAQSTIVGNGALTGNYVYGGIHSTAILLATGYTVNSNVSVTNSTIANNLAPYDGSGVFSVGKTDGTSFLTLKSCIVAGNSGMGLYRFSGTAGINSSGYNIFSEPNVINTVATDQLGVSAGSLNLGALSFNGGFGPTMMPGANSVAINAGTPSDNVRPQNAVILGGRRDVGAAENIPACEVFYNYTQSICAGDSVLFSGIYRKTTGVYSDTITLASCDSIITLNLTVNANPTASISPSTVAICNGGSATLTASGGTTYSWSNSLGTGATKTVSPTSNTTYTVTVTDGNSCSATASRLVTVNNNPTASISPATVAICNGGSATLTASGGTTYSWSNSLGTGATKTVSPTSNTTYTVTVTDGNSCTATASRLVTVNNNPTASISPATIAICNGDNATLTANGGTSYAWNNGLGAGATKTVSPTSNTTYTVTVTDGNSCTATASRLVTVNNNPTASISPATVAICNGDNATLTASGGTTYNWSNSLGTGATKTVSPTSNTTYTVTVTDGNSCTATASRLVTVNALPNAAINGPTTICSGLSATLTASGGTSYAWSNGLGTGATKTVSPTSNTTYTVTVTDGNSCSATASRLVTVNNNPTASISPATVAICNGGSATLTASGGTTYSWSNSLGTGATKTVPPTSNTTYTVTVTDGNGCTATASRLVTVNALPNAAINGPTTICLGLSATLTASGGTSYAWSNGLGTGATKTVSPTSNTTYTVTVTDVNSCTATASQTVSVTTAPTATITGVQTICAGEQTTLTANGGNTYQWANGLGTNASINVAPTTNTSYTVTVTVGANCTATTSAIVTVYQPASTSLNETICAGSGYLFNGITRTVSGTYKDTLQTIHGCDSVITLQLTVTPALTGSITQTICSGTAFNFNGQTLTQAGVYADTLQNTNGCDSIVTLTLTVSPAIQFAYSDSICAGDSYLFNGIILTDEGVYKDTLTTAGGCDSIVTLTLVINPLPQPTIQQTADTLSTQSFATYRWLRNDTVIATTQQIIITQSGNYRVIATDGFGCSDTSNVFAAIYSSVKNIVTDMFSVSMFPNPSNDVVNIRATMPINMVQLSNQVGQLISVEQQTTNDGIILQTHLLSQGIYIVKVLSEDKIFVGQIVKY